MSTEHDERIYALLERLDGKIDGFIQRVVVLETKDPSGKLDKLDDRVRKLEEWKFYILGMAAAAGAAVTLLLKYLHLG